MDAGDFDDTLPKTGWDGSVRGLDVAPGYGTGKPTSRWVAGQRRRKGRNWTFADGHSKYGKDPGFLKGNGVYKTQDEITLDDQKPGIYTYPETTDENSVRPKA